MRSHLSEDHTQFWNSSHRITNNWQHKLPTFSEICSVTVHYLILAKSPCLQDLRKIEELPIFASGIKHFQGNPSYSTIPVRKIFTGLPSCKNSLDPSCCCLMTFSSTLNSNNWNRIERKPQNYWIPIKSSMTGFQVLNPISFIQLIQRDGTEKFLF